MNVVLTGASSELGSELIPRLAAEHELTLLDAAPPAGYGGALQDPGEWEPEKLKELLTGADALIHAALHARTAVRDLPAEQALLDLGGRMTYNLVMAAHQAGLKRCFCLSTLEAFADYDDDLILNEMYEPLPTTDPWQLACHLAECTCREARRELDFRALVVRLGRLVREEAVEGLPYDPLWVDVRDAAEAVTRLLALEPGERRWWGAIHVIADRPDAKTACGPLKRATKWAPEHRFGAEATA